MSRIRLGAEGAGRIRLMRPAAPPTPPELRAGALSGTATATAGTVTLPPGWQPGDYLLVIVNSNLSQTITFTTGAASATLLGSAGFLQAWRVVPTPGATSVTFTVPTSAVLRWWVGAWQNVDAAAVVAAANNLGNNTTAPIEVPVVDLGGSVSTGYEVYVRAAGVNSSATWTTAPSNIFATTTGNAALAVRTGPLAAGLLTSAASAPFDRGLAGTARNESALNLVLPPVQSPVRSLLVNGSFETGAAVATGWETEATAPRLPTCSRVATGVVDGALSQRFQFTGQTGDTGNVAIYQAPIAVNPGDVLRATVYLSGTLTNAYAIFGIEGFVTPGGAYISEHDTTIPVGSLTGTPVQVTVEYICPVNCTAAAVYFQVPTVAPTTAVDVYLDRAVLVRV